MKEKIIYTKWLACALRRQGFRLLRVDVNPNKPEFDCWVFEDNLDLQIAIHCITEDRKNNR